MVGHLTLEIENKKTLKQNEQIKKKTVKTVFNATFYTFYEQKFQI